MMSTLSQAYIHPIVAQKDLWQVKAIVAGILTLLGRLFEVEPFVIAGIFVLVVIDTVTGMIAAFRRGEAITSAGLRKGVPKVTTYTFMLLALIVFGNYAATLTGESSFRLATLYGAVWIGFTEVKSVAENLYGSGQRFRAFWKFITSFFRGTALNEQFTQLDDTKDSDRPKS